VPQYRERPVTDVFGFNLFIACAIVCAMTCFRARFPELSSDVYFTLTLYPFTVPFAPQDRLKLSSPNPIPEPSSAGELEVKHLAFSYGKQKSTRS
jgi:hypothetical protein